MTILSKYVNFEMQKFLLRLGDYKLYLRLGDYKLYIYFAASRLSEFRLLITSPSATNC